MHPNFFELERQVKKVRPDFSIEAWTTKNPLLAKSIDLYKTESFPTDNFGKYVAERIYLDFMKYEDASGGIEQYSTLEYHVAGMS